jgi:hypothetical protein
MRSTFSECSVGRFVGERPSDVKLLFVTVEMEVEVDWGRVAVDGCGNARPGDGMYDETTSS